MFNKSLAIIVFKSKKYHNQTSFIFYFIWFSIELLAKKLFLSRIFASASYDYEFNEYKDEWNFKCFANKTIGNNY